MDHNSVEFSIFLIFTGAAVMATLSLYARQAILVGQYYIGNIIWALWIRSGR